MIIDVFPVFALPKNTNLCLDGTPEMMSYFSIEVALDTESYIDSLVSAFIIMYSTHLSKRDIDAEEVDL